MKKIPMLMSLVVLSFSTTVSAKIDCIEQINASKSVPAYHWHFGLSPVPSVAGPQKRNCLQFMTKAAKAGNNEAQIALADAYYYGQLGVSSPKKALYWYKIAAYRDNAYAAHQVGQFYERGLVVKGDQNESLWWFAVAAADNFAPAQLKIAEHFRYGKGIKTNPNKAIHWYRLAAKNGNLSAQYQLGHYLTQDNQHNPEAYAWLTIAANQGSWFSKLYRNQIMRKMTKSEQQEGQQLLQALNTNHPSKSSSAVVKT